MQAGWGVGGCSGDGVDGGSGGAGPESGQYFDFSDGVWAGLGFVMEAAGLQSRRDGERNADAESCVYGIG